MINDFVMPKLAMAMNEGTINEWLVTSGQYIEKGQEFATVETEKVAYDLESPQSGYFHIQVKAGETVPVEVMIGQFAESKEELQSLIECDSSQPVTNNQEINPSSHDADETPKISAQLIDNGTLSNPGRIIASPLAKKMAKDLNLNLANINGSGSGSGPNGRIIKRDILQAKNQIEEKSVLVSQTVSQVTPLVEQARLPISGIRRAISNAMMDKNNGTATLTLFNDVDVTDLLLTRKNLAKREKLLGSKISVNAIFVKAIAWAAKHVPIVNSTLTDSDIIVWDTINVAVAMTIPSGDGYTENLLVPVIKQADKLSLLEIDLEMKRLISLGREGKLNANDMADSTITFSTTAGIAPNGTGGNSILNGNNSTIVGIGGAKRKAAVYNDELAIRDIAPLCVSYDHRLVDGAPASRFMNYLYQALEDPTLLLT